MKIPKSDPLSAEIAAKALKQGEIIIIPTDTIYGFSGIVPQTDAKIRAIKGREEIKPFIRLIAKPSDIFLFTSFFPEKLLALWPCALTVIVPLLEGGTAAFRCPSSEWLRYVITLCESPLYSTSVNRTGTLPLWRIGEIEAEFANDVALIVDAGDIEGGFASTLIDITHGETKVLRQGTVKI